ITTEDPVAAIAAAALARGARQIADGTAIAPVPVGSRAARLAALGAPGYQGAAVEERKQGSGASGTTLGQDYPTGAPKKADALGGAAPGEGAGGYAVAQSYDVDGDHENPGAYVAQQSGPKAADLVHAPDQHGHAAHSHAHAGDYSTADAHIHSGPHQHIDGTSHEHEHAHDHQHHDHATQSAPSLAQVAGSMDRGAGAQRVMGGHSHGHNHSHDHGHSYRVANGAPLDSALVTAAELRAGVVVSSSAFRVAGGVEGRGLSAEQVRVALRCEAVLLEERALGPYSRNPNGPADAGTPDQAPGVASFASAQPDGSTNAGVSPLTQYGVDLSLVRAGICPLCQGQITALDRDGKPVGGDANGYQGDPSSTGQSDVSAGADGWNGRSARVDVAEFTRAVAASVERAMAAAQVQLAGIQERLARIEAQPQGGGPQLRAADRATPLMRSAGAPSAHDQYAALEALGGKLRDPQAQVAVAAEMIRLQQEAAGMPPAMQVMPRAGRGWGE
ncbi:MAG TPA: hypothetical protein VGR57_20500, partial [Ktedonobacterales bacterium]|nr:hypothetical protein [Ktedonobacterales bacterium]